MRKPLVALGGGFEASSVKLAEDGGSAAQGSPVLAGSDSYGAPWLREIAQKQEGVRAQHTEGSRRSDLQCRGLATSTGGVGGAAFVVWAAQGSSRRLDSLGRRVAAL